MVFQGYFEIMTERLHALMTFAYPFATEFANQFGILFEAERKDAASEAFSGFKHRDIPVGLLECVCRSQA